MNVLDPFEVAEIRVWPLDLKPLNDDEQKELLDRAEFTVFQKLIAESKLGAILNEKPPRPTSLVQLSHFRLCAHQKKFIKKKLDAN